MTKKTTKTASLIKKSKAEAKESLQLVKTLIYCGPSLRDLQQNSVFQGPFPLHVQKHIERCKSIDELFVEPKLFPQTRRKIKEMGTKEQLLYTKVTEYMKGGSNA